MDSSLKGMPKISVLMPVYNCELYIKEAIDSILNQTYTDFEFLIIDDASTDKTVELIKAYGDTRIKLIEKPVNTGYTISLNQGLKLAKGKYIARMDGDDISLPTRFEKQVAFMEINPDVVVCGTCFSIIGTNHIVNVPENHNEIKVGLLKQCKIGHPTVMLRKSTLDANGIFYDNLMEPTEDYDLWVRLSVIGKLHNLQEVFLNYRVHESQVSSVRNINQQELTKQIRFKLLLLLDNSITDVQKEVYLKAIDKKELLTFQEFKILLVLKQQLLHKNMNQFFDSDGFIKYWILSEIEFTSYYFKNRKEYSISVFIEYSKLFSLLDTKLSIKETIKLAVKSLIQHKVK